MEKAEQDRLVEKFLPFARNVAGKVAPYVPLEVDDAMQVACMGLIQAAARFDVSKHDPTIADLDTNFKSFAYLRIRGAIYDEARRLTFVRRRGLEKGLNVQMSSIDEMIESSMGDGVMPRVQLEALAGDPDLVLDFERALKVLTPREKKVVLTLAAGGKGRELASEFGITESRVSQIAASARHKLEEEMVA